ncbi:hypothetical protein SUDANB121_02097 [Nocardiopsis dassonvillei]|uniref:hypothetical protein n=1 Tax=Nocardiopsis dassonvillei TaxID=2014 RepID=UPI003F562E84
MPSRNRIPLTRTVPGVYVRTIRHTCAGGHFAAAWAEAEPLPAGTPDGFSFVDAVPPRGPRGERLPTELADAFADGARRYWTPHEDEDEDDEGGPPPLAALVRLVDARWHGEDSTPATFRLAGSMAAREISRCAQEGGLPRPVLRSRREPYLPWERGLTVSGGD